MIECREQAKLKPAVDQPFRRTVRRAKLGENCVLGIQVRREPARGDQKIEDRPRWRKMGHGVRRSSNMGNGKHGSASRIIGRGGNWVNPRYRLPSPSHRISPSFPIVIQKLHDARPLELFPSRLVSVKISLVVTVGPSTAAQAS